MNLNTIYKALFILILATSCSSSKIVPTTDICSVKKHWKDNVFQVQINKKNINSNWYVYQEAVDVTKLLADQNKCMR
tara:strand:- start:47089 stop:47319 length:231 start_codon:yes stop_codon:yes gene_type:complete